MSIIKSKLERIDEHIIGWYGLLLPILLEVDIYNKENQENKAEVYIKEKYGSLRIELTNCDSYLEQLINRADTESQKICQLCGAKGKTLWIKDWCWTLCRYHAKARKKSNHDCDKTRLLFKKYVLKDNNF